MKLLENILVLDFSQFLSGPSASLRMADLGARVIKIEKPEDGDICRQLYVSNTEIDGESTIFHAINRNKESLAADLKNPDDLEMIKKLIPHADIVMHNFRPGVAERLGIGYEDVKKLNPSIVYGSISGYGLGEYNDLPGQDLLLQSLSGLPLLNNNADCPPTPMGVAVVDILGGAHLAQGLLAALYQKQKTGKGSKVEVSMLESALDFQFEVLACFLNNGKKLPQRSKVNHAHAYVAAPYGVYKTHDGYLALAMGHILKLGQLLGCEDLAKYVEPSSWFSQRDEIKTDLAEHLKSQKTQYWLDILVPADIWCSEVFNYEQLRKQEGYQALDMEMTVTTSAGSKVTTTRCPIKVDGQKIVSDLGAPSIGFDTETIIDDFQLKESNSTITN